MEALINTAVIGTGYLGRFHAEKFAKSKRANLCAVVDIKPENAAKVARSCKCAALADYKELPRLGVKAASVAADTSAHFEIASWLLENGIDVLVEKPITVTIPQASGLIRLAKENGRILQVGHLERFNPAFRAMKSVLTKPRFFEVRRIAQFTGRGADVDVIHDLMIHDIDIVSHLVGRPVEKIEAIGIPVLTGSIDIANARITFEGGAIANVTASRAAFKSERSIRVFQPNLYISLDFGNKRLRIYSRTEKKTLLGFPDIKVDERPVEERDALEDEINSFLDCVQTRGTPEVTGEDGLRALELAEKIHQCLMQNEELAGYIAESQRVEA